MNIVFNKIRFQNAVRFALAGEISSRLFDDDEAWDRVLTRVARESSMSFEDVQVKMNPARHTLREETAYALKAVIKNTKFPTKSADDLKCEKALSEELEFEVFDRIVDGAAWDEHMESIANTTGMSVDDVRIRLERFRDALRGRMESSWLDALDDVLANPG